MFWEILWPRALGFILSAIIQSLAAQQAVARTLGNDSPRSLAIACGLGAASSSCSYAAVAIARSLFVTGQPLPDGCLVYRHGCCRILDRAHLPGIRSDAHQPERNDPRRNPMWNYSTVLNLVFLGLIAILGWRFLRTDGLEMLHMMGSPPAIPGHDHHTHGH